MRRTIHIAAVLLVLFALVGCASPTPTPVPTAVPTEAPTAVPPTEVPAETAAADAALVISGLVANEMSWSEEELKAMEITQAQTENSKGEVDTYEGVLFSTLLDMVEPTADATTLVLLADDGYSVEVAIEDVIANGCIVAFRTKGGLRSAMPGLGGATNVKGLIEIQVK